MNLDDSALFFVGGDYTKLEDEAWMATFFFDLETKSWTQGPDLNVSKPGYRNTVSVYSCGDFNSAAHENRPVIMVHMFIIDYSLPEGQQGFYRTDYLDYLRINEFGAASKWTEGPFVPGKRVISAGSTLYSIGSANKIFQLNCLQDHGCQWMQIGQRQDVPSASKWRLIPESFTESCYN